MPLRQAARFGWLVLQERYLAGRMNRASRRQERIAYIAHLSPEEYARFRERDPGLPTMHADWVAETSKRMDALRRAGVRPALYPIGFDDMVTSLEILGVTDFDAATRDRYAEDMAAADANWSHL